jgi:hypothetical protein
VLVSPKPEPSGEASGEIADFTAGSAASASPRVFITSVTPMTGFCESGA